MSAPRSRNPEVRLPSVMVGGLISLAFWLTLAAAAALFALVALAPRLVQWEQLQARYTANAMQRQALADEISRLEQVVAALEHDPDYARRLAVRDLDVVPPGAVVLSPKSARSPGAEKARTPPTPGKSVPWNELLPWYVPYLQEIAGPTQLRSRMTCAACLLCLLAFTCLNEAFFAGGIGRGLGSLGGWCLRRYVQRRGHELSGESPVGGTRSPAPP